MHDLFGKRPRVSRLLYLVGVGLAVWLAGAAGSRAEGAPIVLPAGQLRFDLAPSNYAYMDHGALNDDRGFRVTKPGDGDVGLAFGAGVAYGVVPDFELGALLVPMQLVPDVDLRGMELYGRFGLSEGSSLSAAAQLTLQLPTDADFGMGIGAPLVFHLSSSLRLDTGGELEILFDPDVISLDVPVALNHYFSPSAFFGLRSGFYFADFSEAQINLGVQAGGQISSGVLLSGSFNWPRFLDTAGPDTVNVDHFEFILGVNYYVSP